MKVHKNIMCCCSAYFRALFAGIWSNTEKRVYNIPGVSPDMMSLIIEYAYTRTITITVDNVEQLLVAAAQFQVSGILKACCEFLESQICTENCIGIWRFADFYNCPELNNKAGLFILHNFEEIVNVSEEFLQLSALELGEIIEKDDLNVKQEDVVFEAILKWIYYDTHNRNAFLPLLLQKVRLSRMDDEYFRNKVQNNYYVKSNAECIPIITSALTEMQALDRRRRRLRYPHEEFMNPLTRPRLPYAVLFAFGGWSGPSSTNVIETYNARADMWVDVKSIGESPRAYHGAVYLKGYMYIIGGFDGVNYFNSVRCYDPVENTWLEASAMHSSRCYVSVTVLNDFIYAMGGFNGHIRLNTAERYAPETNRWTSISSMHEVRSDAGATSLKGKVYICGGFTGNECLFTAETYDPQSDQWTLITPMSSRRSGVGVIGFGEHVYAVGGFDEIIRLRSAEVYDPHTDSWHNIASMLTPRSNFGIEVVDEMLFVVGGYNGISTTFNVECYDKITNEWHAACNMRISRSALSCCIIAGLPNIREYAVPDDSTTKGCRPFAFH
ncbi:kelch-like protein 10 [Protopterus annectens]|uniref:kelch-like protein 10 n=1 Tax=Protopterus annectens TaxID=7888 RepID=UPI001CFC4158|nr:kelch-like protein 10 [Protopterus annectens]